MRYLHRFLLVVSAVMVIACEPSGPYDTHGYHQFTPEEVSFLYLDKDSFNYKSDYEFNNSVSFLMNDSVVYNSKVSTTITSYVHWINIDTQMSLYGLSKLEFPDIFTFNMLTVGIYREFNSHDYTLHIGAGSWTGWHFSKNVINPVFDTAMVLGKVYQDVCKVYPDSTDSYGIKSIYIAKYDGFIKIECSDGNKLELIKLLYKRK